MFMLAGPNGAGKSTLYETVIKPRTNAPFINADVIQRDELKDSSMVASYKAAEIAEGRRRECLAQGRDFVSESTFSHESKLALVADAKAAGFRVAMYHVNVRDANLSVDRVAQRTREGGHDVPEDKIRERYVRNQALIKEAVLQADNAFVYDNSEWNKPPHRAIDFANGKVIRVSGRVPAWARELYEKELERFSPPERARAFEAVVNNELSREKALKAFPELRPAFNELTVAKLKHAREPDKIAVVVGGLQRRLDAGEIPAPARAGPQPKLAPQR